jgi:nucleoid-associated protein YgaU
LPYRRAGAVRAPLRSSRPSIDIFIDKTGEPMSLISFLKDAGEKLFKPAAAAEPAAVAPAPAKSVAELNTAAGTAIEQYIATQNLAAKNLKVTYDGATSAVTVTGEAPDQATREKIILCCGNVHGVAQVTDRMTVSSSGSESTYVTVKSGDTLSKIAKDAYGNANDYMRIFEANKPMLTNPDKIYPGQVLRIPA